MSAQTVSEVVCGYAWPLRPHLLAAGSHSCELPAGHRGHHTCRCGVQEDR